jgi:phage baseplate assembly protein V
MRNPLVQAVDRITSNLKKRIMKIIGRAVIELIDDSKGLQSTQISVLKNEVYSKIERVQSYGLTSHPRKGAEAVVLFQAGSRDHGIVIGVDDRRYRLKNLSEGEVALYTDEGDKIHLKRGNKIDIETQTLTIKAGDSTQTVLPGGKFKFENSSNELVSVLFDLATELENALVITGIGPQPFFPGTKTKIAEIKAKLQSFKG